MVNPQCSTDIREDFARLYGKLFFLFHIDTKNRHVAHSLYKVHRNKSFTYILSNFHKEFHPIFTY